MFALPAVGRPHQLLADGVLGKEVPFHHQIPNPIRNVLGQLIHSQILKIGFHRAQILDKCVNPVEPRNNCLLTTAH